MVRLHPNLRNKRNNTTSPTQNARRISSEYGTPRDNHSDKLAQDYDSEGTLILFLGHERGGCHRGLRY